MGAVECAVNCAGNECERLESSLGADSHNHNPPPHHPKKRDTYKEVNLFKPRKYILIINLTNKKTRTIQQHSVLHYIKGKGTHRKLCKCNLLQ